MMSLIALDFFRQNPLLAGPLVALAIFMLVFLAVTVRTLLTAKQRFEDVASLPLEDQAHAPRDMEVSRG